MQLALLALLLVVIALLVMRAVTRERREYRQFKRLRSTARRQKVYAKWLRESFFMFGGLSAVILLAAWPYIPQVLRDAREWSPLSASVAWLDTGLGHGVAIAAIVLVALALLAPALLLRGHEDEIPMVGDVAALLPRTRGELKYGFGLGLNAGVVEELLFRFAMPALIFGIVGNGLVAFAVASALFGLLHAYQGWVGVLSSTLLGLIFCAVYLLSGSILLTIALHAAFDLRSLVLIPVVVQKVWRVRA